MIIGFRVDANKEVATGHLMRCIAIAKKCRQSGLECSFLIASECEHDIIRCNGFDYHILTTEWNRWDDSIDEVRAYVAETGIDMLIVDSYYVTEKFMNAVNEVVPVFYIDDLCERAYNISVAMHCSQWPEENTLQKLYAGRNTELLSGMKYVPLRDEFESKSENTDNSNRILITMGGTDPYHITLQLVQRIMQDAGFNGYRLVAVLGKMCSDRALLEDMAHKYSRLEVLQNISNMGDVMRQSCVAVSAGGTSVYELYACGIPLVCVTFADNQVDFAKKMENSMALCYAGDIRTDGARVIDSAAADLYILLHDRKKVSVLKKNMSSMVDGNGTQRIVAFIKEYLKGKSYEN